MHAVKSGRPLVLFAVLTAGCSRTKTETQSDPIEPAVATTDAATPERARGSSPTVLAQGVRIVHATADSDAARLIREEQDHATGAKRELVVYVGATWCEPCQVFHRAAQKGDLDRDFPNLTLLEFDLDEDRDRLAAAGYVGRLIPLFAMPRPDGRASDRRFEGSIKGDGAVGNIVPRLRSLLAK